MTNYELRKFYHSKLWWIQQMMVGLMALHEGAGTQTAYAVLKSKLVFLLDDISTFYGDDKPAALSERAADGLINAYIVTKQGGTLDWVTLDYHLSLLFIPDED